MGFHPSWLDEHGSDERASQDILQLASRPRRPETGRSRIMMLRFAKKEDIREMIGLFSAVDSVT